MKSLVFVTFIVTVLLSAGCATRQSQPNWIVGESASYPSAQNLLGRGQAATQEEAKDRARADLAKVFQVAVSVSSENVQKFKSAPASAVSGQYEELSFRSINTRTDQIIRGIQIVELWQDPATKNFHVLAILPRLQAAASLRQQINQLDDDTKNYIEQSQKNSDLFLKIAAAQQAIQSQQERAALQKSLQIVDVGGRGLEPQWNNAKLKADLDELLRRVRIASQVAEDSPPGLQEIVAGALAQAGFLTEAGQNPDFVLQARMSLTDLGLQDGWYWQRGNLEIALSETANGRVRGTKRWVVKGNAADKETAIRRTMDQADKVLKQELGTAIVGLANSP